MILKDVTEVRGMVTEVARAAGVHRTTVSSWMRMDRDSLPNLAEGGRIAKRLGIALDQLYTGLPTQVQGKEIPESMRDTVVMLLQSEPDTQQMVHMLLKNMIIAKAFKDM